MKKFLVILFVAAAVGGCKNDNVEELHPIVTCDTTKAISFANDIEPVFVASCGATSSCHIDANASGGYGLHNYSDVTVAIANGLISSITHDGTVTAMPYDGGKLDDCTINSIIAWVNRGAPNN